MGRGGFLSYFKSVYDLDTLDTRFTTPSGVPYKPSQQDGGRNNHGRDLGANALKDARIPPPKWKTPEFYFYLFVIAAVVPYMFWVPYEVSRPSDPRWEKFKRHLSPGWIPGRQIDASDDQYYTFRSNIPFMALLLVFHPLARQLWNRLFPLTSRRGSVIDSTSAVPSPKSADARLEQRVSFDYAFALVFLVALHGFSAIKVLIILGINFFIGTRLPPRVVPAVTWIFNLYLLVANKYYEGFRFNGMAIMFSTSWIGRILVSDPATLIRWGELLDAYGGIMPRWHVLFNITILRLISFNMDYYWSLNRRGGSPIEKQLDPANLSERDRIATPAEARDYSWRNYVGYAIYAPLYLTGPVMTFNDYVSQQRYKPATIETGRTLRYGIRFVFVLLAMELVLHLNYVMAISRNHPDWDTYTPAQIAMLSFFKLHIIWLKLLIPWRLFRLWGLVDGVDAPENMIRCVSDNYSTLSFWRGWHRSFYRWMLRYIYIPAGGTSFRGVWGSLRSVCTYMLVFTFVAVWHDIDMKLIIWSWLIVFFFLPEIAAGYLFPRRRWENRPTEYRMLCCAGGVLNVLMMISANVVGFGGGVDALTALWKGLFRGFSGVTFLGISCFALFVGIQVMFEIRNSEARRGINLKC